MPSDCQLCLSTLGLHTHIWCHAFEPCGERHSGEGRVRRDTRTCSAPASPAAASGLSQCWPAAAPHPGPARLQAWLHASSAPCVWQCLLGQCSPRKPVSCTGLSGSSSRAAGAAVGATAAGMAAATTRGHDVSGLQDTCCPVS
jgi:hypothetical protein